jgi:glyoxylase-like metal-dependent hydrolase (beta-lactamase superfamily II)
MAATANETIVVGRYRLDPIAEFEGPRMPPAAMFTQTDPKRLATLLERVPPESFARGTNLLLTSVHTWLVRDDAGLVMLIDTCFGNLKNRMPTHPFFHMQKNDWLQRLAALGVEPEDVTHVVNTHLHLDHVGWNTHLSEGAWVPTFRRARHIMPRLEVDLVRAGKFIPLPANDRAIADSVLPILDAGLADVVEPWTTIAPDMRLVPCYGHSPGMLLVEISGGERGIIAGGDPLHHPLQVLDPSVNTGFCERPAEAAAARYEFLARCADEGWTMAPTHFYRPRVARVRRAGNVFEIIPPIGVAADQRQKKSA